MVWNGVATRVEKV